jgi:opacity protein-like surface antigen
MIPFLLASLPISPIGEQPQAPISLAATPITDTTVVAQPAAAESSTAPGPSNSSPNAYPYASIQLGVGFPSDLTGDFDFLGLATLKKTVDLNTGFNGEAAIGYKFPSFRTDLSVGYSSFGSKTQTITVPDFGSASVSGKGSVDLFTVMVNGYYDFKIKNQDGGTSRWSPYIGAGIGWGNLSTPGCAISSCTLFDSGSASTFAYQGKVGVSYRATDSGFVFLEGGYLGTTATTISNVDHDPFGTWRINLGWRQGFGGAPKAKPVAVVQESSPAPAPVAEPVLTPQPIQPYAPIRGLW